VQWARGTEAPKWWRDLPPEILDEEFTLEHMERTLERRKRTPIKSVLLNQEAFPGIGNWMADEVLWRAEIDPSRPAGDLKAEERRAVWREVREVVRVSLRTIGDDYRDPPAGWLFHERWGKEGKCPGTEEPLQRKVVGGRPTCWCPSRQK
jgi:formamidopyrimidine-DNA glycosylase